MKTKIKIILVSCIISVSVISFNVVQNKQSCELSDITLKNILALSMAYGEPGWAGQCIPESECTPLFGDVCAYCDGDNCAYSDNYNENGNTISKCKP